MVNDGKWLKVGKSGDLVSWNSYVLLIGDDWMLDVLDRDASCKWMITGPVSCNAQENLSLPSPQKVCAFVPQRME